ncbi:MAG TPA: LysR family transcriptional regulator [Aliidongia sp.]|uniref:LysR family transcriptional regulator n=1 Tax=Aliidongia sp. TaxID=1914230 RepID=UPI002DDD47E2|nr:LysR family transcriptional regulator [Aliidongia sp.]HEV2678605.1 LysR family transcriptional regulator [Aliidongia sp.]
MEFHQVRYFLAVSRTLNFTRAAEQCNVSQPALTKAVQKLEHELGGALIYRERQLTQLTDLGKIVLPMLENVFSSIEAVCQQVSDYKRRKIAPLQIGLAPSISATLIVEPLMEIARMIPGLQVEMIEAPTDELVELLLDGQVSAALVDDPEDLPERIDHWRLFEERYVVIASPSHPLAAHKSIPIEALADVIWLERVGCEVAGRLRRIDTARDLEPKIGHRGHQESHLQHMAAAGLGVILSPDHVPHLQSLSAIPLEGDCLRQQVELLVVSGRSYSPALQAFVKFARLRDWRPHLNRTAWISGFANEQEDARGIPADIAHAGSHPNAGVVVQGHFRRAGELKPVQ